MVFRSALKPFKAMFRRKASISRVLLLLDFDHRQRIQFFRARECVLYCILILRLHLEGAL